MSSACPRRAARSLASAGWMSRAISNVAAGTRRGSGEELAELVHLQPERPPAGGDRPERSAPARDGREAVRPRRRGATGQSSSTTGCRIGRQGRPPVGIGQSGVPMFSPIVK